MFSSSATERSPTAQGFCDAELARLSACLSRLLPSLRRKDVAMTGGVAIQVGMAEVGRQGVRAVIADLDLVMSSLETVVPSVAESFLVSHYHAVQPGIPKFMVQLVDPVTRIRVDMFPDLVGSLARAKAVQIGTQVIRMLELEDIFEHKLLMLAKASTAHPVDPKHAEDAYALGELLRRRVPIVARDSLVEDVYGIDADARCRRCELSSDPRFPLASKEQINGAGSATLSATVQ
jgi:hypothetical protein